MPENERSRALPETLGGLVPSCGLPVSLGRGFREEGSLDLKRNWRREAVVNLEHEWRKRMGIEPTPDAATGAGQRF